MTWSSQEGQIIGLKKREREAAAQRQDLEHRIERIASAMKRHRTDDLEALQFTIDGAAEQMARALRGQEIPAVPSSPLSGGHYA